MHNVQDSLIVVNNMLRKKKSLEKWKLAKIESISVNDNESLY